MKSMLECFATNELFILNFWKGIEYVAKNLKEQPDEKNTAKLSKLYIASVLEKMSITQSTAYFQLDFCKTILENKSKIKNHALYYADRLINMIKNNPDQTLIPNKIDVLDFFLNFLRHTYFESIIIKCCKIIHQWKKAWPSLWFNSNFDASLEESFPFYLFISIN